MRSGELRIRDDLAVEFHYDTAAKALEVRWDPATPRSLTDEELALYRRNRNDFLQKVAHLVGGTVAVVEL